MNEVKKFIGELDKAFKDIRKVDRETGGNFHDMSVFLDENSKKFLVKNKIELQGLFEVKLHKDTIGFISNYIWKEEMKDKK